MIKLLSLSHLIKLLFFRLFQLLLLLCFNIFKHEVFHQDQQQFYFNKIVELILIVNHFLQFIKIKCYLIFSYYSSCLTFIQTYFQILFHDFRNLETYQLINQIMNYHFPFQIQFNQINFFPKLKYFFIFFRKLVSKHNI